MGGWRGGFSKGPSEAALSFEGPCMQNQAHMWCSVLRNNYLMGREYMYRIQMKFGGYRLIWKLKVGCIQSLWMAKESVGVMKLLFVINIRDFNGCEARCIYKIQEKLRMFRQKQRARCDHQIYVSCRTDMFKVLVVRYIFQWGFSESCSR